MLFPSLGEDFIEKIMIANNSYQYKTCMHNMRYIRKEE